MIKYISLVVDILIVVTLIYVVFKEVVHARPSSPQKICASATPYGYSKGGCHHA